MTRSSPRARARLGCEICQTYGLTEVAGGLVTIMVVDGLDQADPATSERARTSVGREILGVEVAVRGVDGTPLAAGEVGEIQIRSDVVMSGYARDAEASARSLHDGWLLTGDLGRLDADGFLFVVDRRTDVVITGGLNVYTQEVESVLHTLPGIDQAYVFGVPDPVWGERIAACIVLREDVRLDAAAVLAGCEGRLAGYKKPRSIYFVTESELPRSLLGKVQKQCLADVLASRADAAATAGER